MTLQTSNGRKFATTIPLLPAVFCAMVESHGNFKQPRRRSPALERRGLGPMDGLRRASNAGAAVLDESIPTGLMSKTSFVVLVRLHPARPNAKKTAPSYYTR